jgi:uncharacterized SAM-binding protein YcdF (DUF218 family)
MFFIFSKLFWFLITPENWILIGFGALVWMLWRRRVDAARRWAVRAFLLTVCVTFMPVGDFLLAPLENRFPPSPNLDQVDGIILLGGSEVPALSDHWGIANLSHAGERVLHAVALAHAHPNARVLVTGGSNHIRQITNAEAHQTARLALALGINESRLIVEDRARNTYQNAKYSLPLATPKPGETWVLVTSASHMPRAVGVFCALNWPVTPYPVDQNSGAFASRIRPDLSANLRNISVGLKEWIGLFAYWASGRTDAVWPLECATGQ